MLIGSSLGGAVSLQLAAADKRISAVVAAESFSDFRTVAIERAPFVFTPGLMEKAFKRAEEEALGRQYRLRNWRCAHLVCDTKFTDRRRKPSH